jgi:hypothetical protein
MRKTLQTLSTLAVLIAPLAFHVSAFAQTAPVSQPSPAQPGPGAPPPPPPPHAGVPPEGDMGEERQEMREEREKIRAEHDEIMSEHDRLKTQCMDSKGPDRSDCTAKMKALHDRKEALDARREAFREKMKTEHPVDHHDGKPEDGQWKKNHPQAGMPPGPGHQPTPAADTTTPAH